MHFCQISGKSPNLMTANISRYTIHRKLICMYVRMRMCMLALLICASRLARPHDSVSCCACVIAVCIHDTQDTPHWCYSWYTWSRVQQYGAFPAVKQKGIYPPPPNTHTIFIHTLDTPHVQMDIHTLDTPHVQMDIHTLDTPHVQMDIRTYTGNPYMCT